ncbi:hypothetical protein [Nocardia terpenica]|uniref:Cytochrome P450 n=1 Tax=Nocardia terpenica TaxID=455432 RepID=A0A6G9Z621_9NOCA|nr:hypothetical protein [Nocardia terpenica]QIS20968.1 hypothetical protein F6W96_24270 [Nocardia terpenica]
MFGTLAGDGLVQGADAYAGLFTPEFVRDPHPVQATLRQEAAAHRTVTPTGMRMWVVARYEDVRTVLADPTVAVPFGQFRWRKSVLMHGVEQPPLIL